MTWDQCCAFLFCVSFLVWTLNDEMIDKICRTIGQSRYQRITLDHIRLGDLRFYYPPPRTQFGCTST